MSKIKTAIVGLGNCASALMQGIAYYKENPHLNGIITKEIAGYKITDIDIALGIDIDARKVNNTIEDAIFASPNCTTIFYKNVTNQSPVIMGKTADGYSSHQEKYSQDKSFQISDKKEATQSEIIQALKKHKIDILVNFLPVGSQQATEFYMECALEAKVGIVNCIPVFIASHKKWAEKFSDAGVPIIGDDIKSQIGATIIHRTLVDIMSKRGVKINKSYQLNFGGNTDFLNMLDRDRLESKKISKTEAVTSCIKTEIPSENIHIGPSDYVPWLKDNKVCFIKVEGEMFGGVKYDCDLKLSVEDSPNAAAIVVDAIRYCKKGLDNNISGPLFDESAWLMKHPPEQKNDSQLFDSLQKKS